MTRTCLLRAFSSTASQATCHTKPNRSVLHPDLSWAFARMGLVTRNYSSGALQPRFVAVQLVIQPITAPKSTLVYPQSYPQFLWISSFKLKKLRGWGAAEKKVCYREYTCCHWGMAAFLSAYKGE